MQGESDACYTADIAFAYQANLKRLMDLIRAAFREDDLPVVIGKISDSKRNAPVSEAKIWKYGPTVVAAQQKFTKNDENATLVTTTDNYSYSDPWHYDTKGYIDLGKQFANTYEKIINPPKPQ
jgi:hypothetical protein